MAGKKRFRVFATSRIGEAAEGRLRERDYDLEVYEGPEAPPKKLIIEKVKSGIDGLITTLRDPIDAEARNVLETHDAHSRLLSIAGAGA